MHYRYTGPLTVDDTITLSPFGDPYYRLVALTGAEIEATITTLLGDERWRNVAIDTGVEALGSWVWSPYDAAEDRRYDVVLQRYDVEPVIAALRQVTGKTLDAAPYRHGEVDATSVWEQFIRSEWRCD